MSYSLVGYTGFVGSNIEQEKDIINKYNSKNIKEAYDTEHDVLIYSGVRAEKFLANTEPDKDKVIIYNAIENIKKLKFKKLILISTVDVYKEPFNVTEKSVINEKHLHAYGLNRYYLEKWIMDNVKDYNIIRLPGLFGKNLKKNFIFDIMNIIPTMLKHDLYFKILQDNPLISNYYEINGMFYKIKNIASEEKSYLKEFFKNYSFNALNFTDSKSIFQFYNLCNLWRDINTILQNDIKLFNIATEPIQAGELYKYIYGRDFNNNITDNPVVYDVKSIYAEKYYNNKDYLYLKNSVLDDIKSFVLGN